MFRTFSTWDGYVRRVPHVNPGRSADPENNRVKTVFLLIILIT